MNKYLTNFLLFFILPLALAFGIDAVKRKIERIEKRKLSEAGHFAKKATISEQKKFVIIIPSFNNEDYVIQNLGSVLNQEYENYRVIYIDDASTDKTLQYAQKYIQNHKCKNRITLIHNQNNQGALANIFNAINSCQNNEIVVLCDGDDWLSHYSVLSKLNEYYANKDVWLTWGNYIDFPHSKGGESWPVSKQFLQKGQFRSTRWFYSHLRTFYAALFKRIKKHDLTHNNTFFKTCYDLAIMFPMLEMARDHAYFTKDIFYIYNRQTPLNDDKVYAKNQKETDKFIRNKKPYKALESLKFE